MKIRWKNPASCAYPAMLISGVCASSSGAVLMPYITGAVAQRLGLWAGMLCTLAALAGMAVCSAVLWRMTRRRA